MYINNGETGFEFLWMINSVYKNNLHVYEQHYTEKYKAVNWNINSSTNIL